MNPREARDELIEAGADVHQTHRTDRAWAFGWGEEFGAPPNTSGADCRCGKRFLHTERAIDPHYEWAEHWAEHVLDALLSRPELLVSLLVERGVLEQVGWRIYTGEMIEMGSFTARKLQEATDAERAKSPWFPLYRVVVQ